EQNLLPDTSGEPVRHPQVAEVFEQDEKGSYRPRNSLLHLGPGFWRRAAQWFVRLASTKGGSAGADPGDLACQRGGAVCWPSSFLRASSPRFSNSSCNRLFWSATALGSLGGPSNALAKSASGSGMLRGWPVSFKPCTCIVCPVFIAPIRSLLTS